MYPLCDVSECAVLEAGRYLPNGVFETPLKYVSPKLIEKNLVPSSSFLEQHRCSTQRNGIYIRYMNYTYDRAYLDFNENLFRFREYPYNASSMELGNFVFQNFTQDNEASKV